MNQSIWCEGFRMSHLSSYCWHEPEHLVRWFPYESSIARSSDCFFLCHHAACSVEACGGDQLRDHSCCGHSSNHTGTVMIVRLNLICQNIRAREQGGHSCCGHSSNHTGTVMILRLNLICQNIMAREQGGHSCCGHSSLERVNVLHWNSNDGNETVDLKLLVLEHK